VRGYVQAKKSQKEINVSIVASKVPLYGAVVASGASGIEVILTAQISVCSNYHIMGQMVKSKFCARISCADLHVNSHTMALLTPLKSVCSSSQM
jgi:hypothetical protein